MSLRKLLSIPNLVTTVTILLGAAASIGLTEPFFATEKILTALVTLIAAQLLVDRLGILSSIQEKVGSRLGDHSVELLPRTDLTFERFSVIAKGASELLVVGVDLAFLATADAWFVREAVESGADLKLLIADPSTSGDLKDVLNTHDERNTAGMKPVHDHVASAGLTVETLSSLISPNARGSLEIRARVDIPNPTMTLIDPTKRHGKIRVDLKLYKRNHGEVPYFVLTRSSAWYDVFFNHYYVKLWGDSKVLFNSRSQTLGTGYNVLAQDTHRPVKKEILKGS